MLGGYVEKTDPRAPLDALVVGDRPEPEAPEGWVVVDVRAASVNRHDLWPSWASGCPTRACR
jgi:NADPH:quinone reductase-like Zn-dependent oxidoreductase